MKRIGRKYATFQEKETLDFWQPRVRCCAIPGICDEFGNKWKHTSSQVCLNLVGCFSFKKKPFHRRLTIAEQVLLWNDLNQDEFAEAVQVLLREGKYCNILLTGIASCG